MNEIKNGILYTVIKETNELFYLEFYRYGNSNYIILPINWTSS